MVYVISSRLHGLRLSLDVPQYLIESPGSQKTRAGCCCSHNRPMIWVNLSNLSASVSISTIARFIFILRRFELAERSSGIFSCSAIFSIVMPFLRCSGPLSSPSAISDAVTSKIISSSEFLTANALRPSSFVPPPYKLNSTLAVSL
jgi:hypothetical protein